MKKLLTGIFIALLLSCSANKDVIAKVGKEKITQQEFDTEVAKLTKAMVPADYVMKDDEKLKFESQILNNMIMKIAYNKVLDKLDIQADEEKLTKQFETLTSQYGTEEALKKDIESKGFTLDEIKDEFRYQYRLSSLSDYAAKQDVEIPEEEIKAYYNDNKETTFAIQPRVNLARHILIKADGTNQNVALEKIKKIREEIVNGKDFAEAAKEYSEGPSGQNGGKLENFGIGDMAKEFEMVAFAIPLNEVSEPVLTQFGYHLIKVESRTEKSYADYNDTVEFINKKIKVDRFFKNIEEEANITKPDWLEL